MRKIPKLTSAVLATAFSVGAFTVTDLSAQVRAVPPAGPAANVLRLREQLKLSEDQVKQLEGLSAKNTAPVNRAAMMRAQADLLEARKGDINIEKARTAYDQMARLRTDQQLARLKTQQDVRNVLTVDQRTKVDALANRMQHRRGAQGVNGRNRGAARRAGKAARPGTPRVGQRNRRPPADRLR